MSYFTYKFLHLIGVFMLLFSLGSLIVSRSLSLTERSPWSKTLSAINGIGLLIVLIAGFGLLARLGIAFPWQGWVFLKIFIWILLAFIASIVARHPASGRVLWWVTLFIASAAAWLASFKPF
jgi:hypothetical protein